MDQPPKKRHRFTFSLSALMVFMLVVGVLLGLTGLQAQRARKWEQRSKEQQERAYKQGAILDNLELSYYTRLEREREQRARKHQKILNELKLSNRRRLGRARERRAREQRAWEQLELSDDMRLERAREHLSILKKLKASGFSWYFVTPDDFESEVAVYRINLPVIFVPSLKALQIDSIYLDKIIRIGGSGNDNILDLAPLADLKNLEWIQISGSKVSDLTPLAGLKNLRVLDVSNTRVTDLTPLAQLKSLERLEIRNTQITDLTPLVELENLDRLEIKGTPVSDQQIQQLKIALPDCLVYYGPQP